MAVTEDLAVDKSASHIQWARSPIALHSHHYHFQLQNTLQLTDFLDGGDLTRETARWTIATLLRNKFGAKPDNPQEVLNFAKELFYTMGFGTVDIPGADQGTRDNPVAPTNMYADGWTAIHGYRDRKTMQCNFPAGYIAGALSAAYGRPYDVRETACKGMGAERCTFTATEAKEEAAHKVYDTNPANITGPAVDAPPPSGAAFSHGINEGAIMDAILSLPLMGDAQSGGLVNKFGILLNWTPQQYYSGIEYTFITKLAEFDLGLERSAEELLHFDGEACALNTFHGITRSDEWKGLIKPMLAKPGDGVVALNAIMNCLGWGRAQIQDLSHGEGVRVNLYGGQEGLGYRTMFGISEKPRCYAFSGAVRALMEVFLPGEVVEAKFGRFTVEETKCVAMGHPHCEFVAKRN